MRDIDMKYHYI